MERFPNGRIHYSQLLINEDSQSVSNCHRLKMLAEDGKNYLTDFADPKTISKESSS